jgi:cytochrome c oxidase subunit II
VLQSHFRYRAIFIFATAVLAVVAGCAFFYTPAYADIFTPRSGGSPNADAISEVYKLLLILAVIIFVAVEGALIWFLIKYRARRHAEAHQTHGNTKLEIGWTAGAVVILLIITAFTFFKLGDIINPAPSDIDANGNAVTASANSNETKSASLYPLKPPKGASMTIRINGRQFIWRYQYPGPKEVFSYEEMVVPVGMTVLLNITSDDVAHSWWIPHLGGKFDAIPGYFNHTWFKVKKAGVYIGQCAELCGRAHANMTARVRAVPFDQYRKWYNRQAAEIVEARTLAAQEKPKYSPKS